MKCTRCQSEARRVGPSSTVPEEKLLWGCPTCGFVFHSDGREVHLPGAQMAMKGGLAGAVTSSMDKVFKEGGKPLSSSEAAVIQAIVSDLYMQAFTAGVKQGLLLGTVQTKYKERKDNGEVRN